MCGNHQHDSNTSTAGRSAPADPEVTTSSCCGGDSSAAPTAPAQDGLAECPVMPGSVVDKAAAEAVGLYRDHNGQRYWFCCAACGPMWDADPAKYAAA
jgi:YHS domain-containing protein